MSGIPQKAGVYWASSGSCQWFNWIVDVQGEPPFLTMRGYDFMTNKSCPLQVFDIQMWGPQIIRPDKPKEPSK